MSKKVVVNHQDGVTIITINRPDKHNCIDGETAQLLYEAWVDFREDDHAKVAILTGSGASFSSGADLKAIDTLGPKINLMQTLCMMEKVI